MKMLSGKSVDLLPFVALSWLSCNIMLCSGRYVDIFASILVIVTISGSTESETSTAFNILHNDRSILRTVRDSESKHHLLHVDEFIRYHIIVEIASFWRWDEKKELYHQFIASAAEYFHHELRQ